MKKTIQKPYKKIVKIAFPYEKIGFLATSWVQYELPNHIEVSDDEEVNTDSSRDLAAAQAGTDR